MMHHFSHSAYLNRYPVCKNLQVVSYCEGKMKDRSGAIKALPGVAERL